MFFASVDNPSGALRELDRHLVPLFRDQRKLPAAMAAELALRAFRYTPYTSPARIEHDLLRKIYVRRGEQTYLVPRVYVLASRPGQTPAQHRERIARILKARKGRAGQLRSPFAHQIRDLAHHTRVRYTLPGGALRHPPTGQAVVMGHSDQVQLFIHPLRGKRAARAERLRHLAVARATKEVERLWEKEAHARLARSAPK